MFDNLLGLSGGELFVAGFIVLAILTARYWPALGEKIALLLAGQRDGPKDPR